MGERSHAQQADRQGNVQLWGLTGVQKEAALAAERVLVTVEEITDELQPRPGGVVLPSWAVTAVAEVPGGAHPSYAAGYSVRDNDFYQAWPASAAYYKRTEPISEEPWNYQYQSEAEPPLE